MKIIFSPKLIDNLRYDQNELSRFDHILDFLLHCVIDPVTDYFYDCPSFDFLTSSNFKDNTVKFNVDRTNVLRKYIKLLSYKKIQTDKQKYDSIFEHYINNQATTFVLFVGKDELPLENHKQKGRDNIEIECIQLFNPYTCDYKQIEGIVKKEQDTNGLFENQLCEHTNKYFEPYRKLKDSERNEYDFSFGKIVADRHVFIYSKELSKINTIRSKSKRRDVYVKYYKRKPIYYISIDTEHGALEVFLHQSKSPKHIGEYNFSCNKIKDADRQHHKLYLNM